MAKFEAKEGIEKLQQLLTKCGSDDPSIGLHLRKLGIKLRNQTFADDFLLHNGLLILCEMLKFNHETVLDEAMKAFLNLMCHFSVLSKISLKSDGYIFSSIIDLTFMSGAFGEVNKINRALCVLSLLLGVIPQSFKDFHESVNDIAKTRSVRPYSNFISLLVNKKFFRKSLNLLELILRRSLVFNLQDEVIALMSQCNIQASLNKLMETSEETSNEDKLCIRQVQRPFGDALSKVQWRHAAIAEESFTSLASVLQSEIDEDKILELIDQRLNVQLEEEMAFYDNEFRNFKLKLEDRLTVTPEIFQIPVLRTFYMTVQAKLKRLLLALRSVGTNTTKMNFTLASQVLSLPRPQVAKTFTDRVIMWYQKKFQVETTFCLPSIEKISEATSRKLTLRYYSQLSRVSKATVGILADCAVWRMLEGIRNPSINVDPDIFDQLLFSVSSVSLAKTMSIPLLNGCWTESGFFTKPGISFDGVFYYGHTTDPVTYGYRLGTVKEIKLLGLIETPCNESIENERVKIPVIESYPKTISNLTEEKGLIETMPLIEPYSKIKSFNSTENLMSLIKQVQMDAVTKDKRLATLMTIVQDLTREVHQLKKAVESK